MAFRGKARPCLPPDCLPLTRLLQLASLRYRWGLYLPEGLGGRWNPKWYAMKRRPDAGSATSSWASAVTKPRGGQPSPPGRGAGDATLNGLNAASASRETAELRAETVQMGYSLRRLAGNSTTPPWHPW